MFFLGIGVFLVWWSLHQIPNDKWDDFKQSLVTANFWLLIPVFIILSLSHVLRAIRWKTLMQPMGYTPTFTNTFFAVMIGYLANLAIPRLGEVLKCTLLTKYENVPTEKLVGTIVVERVIDVICLATVFVLAFIVQNDVFLQAFEHMQSMMQTNTADTNNQTFSYIKYILLVLIVITVVYLWLSGAAKKASAKITNIAKGMIEGLLSIKNLQQKRTFILCTIGIWGLYIIGTWVGLYATNGSSHLGISTAISALAFASIGMIITPGGIGAYAILLAKVLELNGVSYETGFANGTLQWFAQFLIVVIVGFICLGLLPWFNKKRRTA